MSANEATDKQGAVSDLVLYADEIEYFDTHDLSEDLEKRPEVHFEIGPRPRRKHYPLDEELSEILADAARRRGVSAVALLNQWVREKAAESETVGAVAGMAHEPARV